MLKEANTAARLEYCSFETVHLNVKLKEELQVRLRCHLSLLHEQTPHPNLDTLASRRYGGACKKSQRKAWGSA